MTNVKLSVPLLIGDTHRQAGDIVSVHDERAAELVKLKHAEKHDAAAKVVNPDDNPFADVITPFPPDGVVVNPVDGLAPNVNDNPGLKKLAEITGGKAKSSRVFPEDIAPAGSKSATPKPGTTANELTPKVS